MSNSRDHQQQQDDIDLSDLGSALPSAAHGLKSELHNPADELLESFAPKVRKRIEVLREIQIQHDELEAKYFEERAALEAKYHKLYEPLYTKRFEIVNGVVEVEDNSNETAEDKAAEEKGVPGFWLTALKTHEVLVSEIHEHDEGALKFVKDIKWCRMENFKGFKLEFFFDHNPYFKNSILTKTYHMVDVEEQILEKAIGTEIEWLPGKCLTQKVLIKKPKKGSTKIKPITKTEKRESFFNFFNPPTIPGDDDIDEDMAEELEDQLEQDYDIGCTIRDKIIPHAVSWFTGEAVPDDHEDYDDDEEDEDEEDEDEEDEDEEDDDEEEASKVRKKSAIGHERSRVGHPVDRQPAECKQHRMEF